MNLLWMVRAVKWLNVDDQIMKLALNIFGLNKTINQHFMKLLP